jgi:hypothetical protein
MYGSRGHDTLSIKPQSRGGMEAQMANRKRSVSIRSEINTDLNTVRFWAFDYNTEKPVAGFDFRCDVNKVNPALHRYAILDGIKDSIRDAGALGADASLKSKFDAMLERSRYLESGADSWQRGREAGEGSILFAALMMEKPDRDRAKVRAMLSEMSATKKTALENSDRLRDIVAQIRAERGKGVDTDELFAELDD